MPAISRLIAPTRSPSTPRQSETMLTQHHRCTPQIAFNAVEGALQHRCTAEIFDPKQHQDLLTKYTSSTFIQAQSKKHKNYYMLHTHTVDQYFSCLPFSGLCFCRLHPLHLILHLHLVAVAGAGVCTCTPAPVPISPGFPPQTSPPTPEPRERGPSQPADEVAIQAETAKGTRWQSLAAGRLP